MGNPEIKILRDELAKAFAQISNQQKIINQLTENMKKSQAINTEMILKIQELAGKLAFYENPHSPSSVNNIPTRQKKANRTKKNSSSPSKKAGAKIGHVGVSNTRKSDYTKIHKPKKCAKCGSKDITDTKILTKMTIDIPHIPKTEYTNNIIHQCICKCGYITTPQVGIDGTSIGKNLMTVILSLQKQNNSLNSIKEIVNLTDASLCKKTIQNALFAVGKTLESDVELWMKNINKSKYLKFDETTYTMYNKQGYVWTCISDNEVFYHADKSRAAAVLDLHFPYWDIPITVDGYAAYNRFKTIQRCWSHILRDAEFESVDESKTILYEKLRLLYHNAKQISLQPDAHVHYDSSVISCMAIANTYKNLNCKFGDKLARATPNLFTFLKYPGMEPTNNESERMLRKVVISRKIRQRLVTEMGMKIFGILMSCFMTWQKRGTSIPEEVLKLY